MRSDIFNEFADLPKNFIENLGLLWAIPADKRDILITFFSKFHEVNTTTQHKVLLNEIISQIDYEPDKLLRAIDALTYIYAEWNPFQATVENILHDLEDLAIIPIEKSKEAKDFLSRFLKEVEKDNARRLKKYYAASSLPSFMAVKTLVDYRAMIKEPYGVIPTKINDYKPKCLGFVPVVILNIKRDSGQPRDVLLQCDESSLQILIDNLLAVQEDLKTIKTFVSMKEEKTDD